MSNATATSSKLATLLDLYGFADVADLCDAYFCEGTCPGICRNPGCEYTEEYEPDQREGWCPECHSNTVVSGFILGGII